MLVVLDIDGTLLDLSRRMKKAGPRPSPKASRKEWTKWLNKLQPTKELLKDRPFPAMHALLDSLRGAITLVYVTGRSEEHHQATREWLLRHQFPAGPLYMRGLNDWRSARDYKAEVMKKIVKELPEGTPVVVFDDDDLGDCSEMYRKNGWLHLKVLGDK